MCRKVWCYTNYDIEGGNFAPKQVATFRFPSQERRIIQGHNKANVCTFFHEINKKTEFRILSKNVLER